MPAFNAIIFNKLVLSLFSIPFSLPVQVQHSYCAFLSAILLTLLLRSVGVSCCLSRCVARWHRHLSSHPWQTEHSKRASGGSSPEKPCHSSGRCPVCGCPEVCCRGSQRECPKQAASGSLGYCGSYMKHLISEVDKVLSSSLLCQSEHRPREETQFVVKQAMSSTRLKVEKIQINETYRLCPCLVYWGALANSLVPLPRVF